MRQEVGGRKRAVATPRFVVLVLVETTDLIFAVDSIPAIFAITQDPFIVYTSNIFAILGLRALYYEVPVGLSLGVIALVLGTAVAASLLWPKSAEAYDPVTHDPLAPTLPEPVRSPAFGSAAGRRRRRSR